MVDKRFHDVCRGFFLSKNTLHFCRIYSICNMQQFRQPGYCTQPVKVSFSHLYFRSRHKLNILEIMFVRNPKNPSREVFQLKTCDSMFF